MKITVLDDDVVRIKAPGAYEMSPDAYYGDPCPSPSLTQSIIKIALDKSPAHAWLAHPRLNANYEPKTARNMELGTVAHALMIGRGRDIVVVDADSYRTKAAAAERDDAIAAGKAPILAEAFKTATRMVEAARRQFGMIEGCERAFRDGHGELVLTWEEAGLWLRTQIDWTDPQERIVWDYKTTGGSAAPHRLASAIPDGGYDIQGGMYERGFGMLDPASHGHWRFRFVVQETEEPFALSVVELDEAALTMGRKKVSHGIDIWRRCVEADYWPAYPLAITRPEYPVWAENSWLQRELAYSEIAGTVLDPFHAIMGAASPSRSGMLTEITG